VRAIAALGKSLRLTLIGEGVETAEQLRFLANEKCDHVQGYFFSKPVSADVISGMLRAGRLVDELTPHLA
jgi:EAL domain-containing protein (putative c-di-GMP-specific phosphodiesterase class I)